MNSYLSFSETATSNMLHEPACLSNHFELALHDNRSQQKFKIFNKYQHNDFKQYSTSNQHILIQRE